MKEIIYYCDRCHRKISEEEAMLNLLNLAVDPSKVGIFQLCNYCFSEYQALKEAHNNEIINFMYGEVFINEGK